MIGIHREVKLEGESIFGRFGVDFPQAIQTIGFTLDSRDIDEIASSLGQCGTAERWRIQRELDGVEGRGNASGKGRIESWRRAIERSRRWVEARWDSRPSPRYPAELPVSLRAEEILNAVTENQVVIVAGETGSGKTTQLPKMLLDAGRGVRGVIGVTQPRRVAAQSISRRIAEELGVTFGREVGCKVRFGDDTSSDTRIKLMTDGILLAEAQGDPLLAEYDALVIDEAHERSLNIDFVLGYLNLLRERRPDLKIIITSATIDTELFSKAFGGAPIIEVSGRMYPVDVVYSPISEEDEAGGVGYIEAAANAVDAAVDDPTPGDILVFMPGERDIRELRDQVEDARYYNVEVIPLFGRLSANEQRRVFEPSERRRVVIATNVAETSLTIPNIRYVVDPGLARVSRYSPRSRAKRLPIEPISQSSANQRKGRCGRVANGVCVRLYSEEDFESRPEFTQPEIQRSNLAEVILRMKAFHLGEIETFPFINAPQETSIRAGYKLLIELGAMSKDRELTDLGMELAGLPIDPTIGRMVLQAREERAITEALVIAAALSVQDPRERPMENEKEADAAHREFVDPESDFVTYLNLWNETQKQWSRLKTQSRVRKFCRQNFINFNRLREWRDIHAQIYGALKENRHFTLNETPASYASIHRSIAAGLLTHVAHRTDRNWYQSTANRKAMIFPASGLFERTPKGSRRKSSGSEAESKSEKTNQPRWILAGEYVETSQLFARNVAKVDPQWIVQLGGHLCNYQYIEPRWDEGSGRTLIREKITLGGLELINRSIDFGRVAPEEATDLFIREGLVAGRMEHRYEFIDKNQVVFERVKVWGRRSREVGLSSLETAIYEFYAKRLEGVSSVHDLNRLIKEKGDGSQEFLVATESELLPGFDIARAKSDFPEAFVVGEHRISVAYTHAPGAAHDGAQLKIPSAIAQRLTQGTIDWLIPGFRRPLIEALIDRAPKEIRRALMPVPERAAVIAREMKLNKGAFAESLQAFLRERFRVESTLEHWDTNGLEPSLTPSVLLVDDKGRTISEGRRLSEVFSALKEQRIDQTQAAWGQIAARYERFHLESWSFGDPPERIEAPGTQGRAHLVFPGLHLDQSQVNLRLFKTREQAARASVAGFRALAEKALGKEMAWLRRDLRALSEYNRFYAPLGSFDTLVETAVIHCQNYLFETSALWPLKEAVFLETIGRAKKRVPGLAGRVVRLAGQILQARHELSVKKTGYPELSSELASLVPADFLRRVPHERLEDIPRFLEAKRIRAERAEINPSKDATKSRSVRPYVQKLSSVDPAQLTNAQRRALSEYRWMLEEYRISVFAQELGVRFPVSPKRLDAKWSEVVRV